ncbi:60S ribosomal protein L7a-like [Piliocolobus tephrosceles]|uniref:60S ribosomal protein L7a-like n=1 Tax=Piliocolobus tephrosceles TaxID=591936 RepID=UPI000C29E661|nr:60S ribosomal protein L7a-like [Piliocolobus tephrosceles]
MSHHARPVLPGSAESLSSEAWNIYQTKTFFSFLLPPKMLEGKKDKGKKVAPATAVAKKQEARKVVKPVLEKRAKNLGIGQHTQPKKDLTCFVKWPCFIRVQWQRAVLYTWLKVLTVMNQFTQALDPQRATQL